MAKAAQSLSPNHIPIFRPYTGIALVLARRMARKAERLALTMLALVMTKERAVAMAKPSVLPLTCCAQSQLSD
jgi:hypothetical protein